MTETGAAELGDPQRLDPSAARPANTSVGFSVREPGPAAPDLNIEQYHAILANTADYMVERFDAQILFVPMEGGENKDPQHSHAVGGSITTRSRGRSGL